MRVQVDIDVKKFFQQGIKVVVGKGFLKWVDFKDERLFNFFYVCVFMGHLDKDYFLWDNVDDENLDLVYGEQMQVIFIKRVFQAVQEERLRGKEYVEMLKGGRGFCNRKKKGADRNYVRRPGDIRKFLFYLNWEE